MLDYFKIDSDTAIIVSSIVFIGFIIDQLSKQIVASTMKIGESKNILGTPLKVTHVRNHYGPMGTLESRTWLINLIFAVVIVLNILLIFPADINEIPIYTIGISLMLAGNLGNLFCKVFRDGVIDFIDLGFSVPNIADFLLAWGICLVFISLFL